MNNLIPRFIYFDGAIIDANIIRSVERVENEIQLILQGNGQIDFEFEQESDAVDAMESLAGLLQAEGRPQPQTPQT